MFKTDLNPAVFFPTLLRALVSIPVTLVVAGTALAVAWFPPALELFQYDRGLIEAGEWWRIATCHVTHWNGDHLQWDLLMFVLLGAICEWRGPRQMRACLLWGGAAVSSMVWLLFPEIEHYRGLSGIDTGLFVLLAIGLVAEGLRTKARTQVIIVSMMLFGLVGKTLFEAIVGQSMFVAHQAADFSLLVWDHIAGGLVGLGTALVASRDVLPRLAIDMGNLPRLSRVDIRTE